MDRFLENCIIIAVLILIISIPLGLAVNSSRKRKKKRINFELLSAESNLRVSFEYTDQLYSFVIAMDPGKKMLIKMDLLDYQLEQFALNEISSCVLEEKKFGDAMQLLQLILRDKSQKGRPIVFFKQHKDSDWHLKRSISVALQWKLLINNVIRRAA